jgi:hypothetical protein
MSSDIPNKFTAKTDIGSFEVTISNRDYINIGSKNYCVQIAYNTKKNTANLDWLGTEKGGCELNGKEIHGDNTIIMTDLAFTILKQLYPNVNPNISLCDSSTFTCRLPNNNPVSISLMKYNLLLTGETYYQRKFLAKLKYIESEPAYNKFLENRSSNIIFDKNYDFNNNELNMILQPILQNSTNWGNFFDTISKRFGRNTCTLVYSWYLNLYGFLAKEAIHSEWSIDLNTRPLIKYTITNKNKSTNYTRKSYVYNPYNFGGGYYPRLLSYKQFINKPISSSKTLKSKKVFV